MEHRIWNIIHDGTIDAVCVDRQAILLDISILYLTERLPTNPEFLVVRLDGVELFTYTPWDSDTIQDPTEIATHRLEVLSADLKDDVVQVVCVGGMIHARYESVEVSLQSGKRLPIEELEAVSITYWEEFEARGRAKRS